jgi:MFS family permease
METGNREGHVQNLARDTRFKYIIVASTLLAVGTTFGFLAALVLEPSGGLSLRWHWSVVLWVAAGFASVLYVWRYVWAATLAPEPRNKLRLKRALILFVLISLGSFVYPLRFVFGKLGGAYLFGLAAAAAALGVVALLLRWFVRIFNEADRKELAKRGESEEF